MAVQTEYERWLASPVLTEDERIELVAVRDDPKAIEDMFFAPLAFGTAGLRGVMGPGLNRMNPYVVRQTTQALAALILREGAAEAERGVAIAYDCRHHAEEYAREAACVLAGNGIPVYLFDALRPTPELSFAIRRYGLIAGINITASHNPKEYNGYKVYWKDGAQMPPEHAGQVAAEMGRIDIFTGAKTLSFEAGMAAGLIRTLGDETDEEFLAQVLAQSSARDAVAAVADRFPVVYTPFHGAGWRLVPEALARLGFTKILCEPAQMERDGDFPTVASPNPENKEGFAQAIELARQNGAELIIGTDPDADRVGIVLRDGTGDYVTLSGNQVGVLLTDYLLRARKAAGTLPARPAVVTTIVSTPMARAVAERHGAAVYETFTGFRFIAEVIGRLERAGEAQFLLGFEESYGYLAGDYARDKDAVTAAMLIAEMAAWHAEQGRTLYDAMQALYATYGHYREVTLNLVMPGVDGLAHMKALMADLRREPPVALGGLPVVAVRDYLAGTRADGLTGRTESMSLKGSDVLSFELADGTRVLARPSGTEPKIKIYLLTRGETPAEAERTVEALSNWAEALPERQGN